jgi:hypothetical protein
MGGTRLPQLALGHGLQLFTGVGLLIEIGPEQQDQVWALAAMMTPW